jgi:hypothetical protein
MMNKQTSKHQEHTAWRRWRAFFECERLTRQIHATGYLGTPRRDERYHSPLRLLSFGAAHMSRDWWAVLVAAIAAALVKLGVIAGVPW